MQVPHVKVFSIALFAAVLAACGGGKGGDGTAGNTPGNTTTPTDAAIDAALASGNPSALNDPSSLAQRAWRHATALSQAQATLTDALYVDGATEYLPTNNSQFVLPGNAETSQPLVVGDAGELLAAVRRTGNERAAGYGFNIAESLRSGANLAYAPSFKRLVTWLVTGDATGTLPASTDVAVVGVSAPSTVAGLAKAGITATSVACDPLADATCAAKVKLVVVGGGVAADTTLTDRVRARVAAGTPVLYLHTNGWGDSASGRQVLAGMGLELGGYAGNYFAADKVAAGRTRAVQRTKVAQFDTLLPLLDRLANDGLRTDYDWSTCTTSVGFTSCDAVPGLDAELMAPAERVRAQLNAYNTAARPLFASPDTTLLRLLTLWADATRRQIAYPLDKAANGAAFQRALVADAWVTYVRDTGGRQADLGTFQSSTGAAQQVSTSDETVTVTLNGASGFTAIGRFAVPGAPLQVTLLDTTPASVSLRFNSQRTGSTRLWSAKGFNRPRYLSSPSIALATGQTVNVVTPYGGNVLLAFSGADGVASVKLRVRGVARQPFLDTTQGADRNAYAQALATTTFDWTEIKLGGLEAHARVDKVREVLQQAYANDVSRYLDELDNYFFDGAQALAGFSRTGKSLPAAVLSFCTARQWNCTDTTIHRTPPSTQHINVDLYAQCGSGCSGNPYDQTWGLTPRGWGESHELGHNLQTGTLMVHGGRSSEVSNNVFPLQKNWRLYRDLGVDQDSTRVSYRKAFDLLVTAKQSADPVTAAYDALWADDGYAVQNGERLSFYMQWVHYWRQRTGDAAQAFDIVTLLYLHDRLMKSADWDTNKVRLGYGAYATRPSPSGNDNLLIALSTITQRDQRPTFDLWGVTYTAAAGAQVAAAGHAVEPAFFYANTQTNNHATARRVDMSVASPAWPF